MKISNQIVLNSTINKAKLLLKDAKLTDNKYYVQGLSRQFHSNMQDYYKELEHIGKDLFNRSSTDLRAEQFMNELLKKFNSKVAKFYISISKPDTENEIIKIKQKLKQQYGVKNLYCDNNADFARRCLSVAKLLQKHGIKMPKTIIGSDNYQKNSGIQFNIDRLGQTIVLNTEYNSMLGITKSKNELLVHEIIHTLQKNILSLNQKKLPKEYTKLKNIHPDVLLDIQYKCNQEAHVNLFVKSLLSRLSGDENKLLQYLNSLFL